MSEQATGEAPVLTPRLVFDSASRNDEDIPLFLRKDRKASKSETPVEIKEPEAIIAVVEPVEDVSEEAKPLEAPVDIQAPAAIEKTTLVETKEDVLDTMQDVVENDEPVSSDLDELSVEELKRHQEEVDRKIREKQEAEKKAVIEQIVGVVNTFKIPVDELVDALGGLKVKRKGVKAVQKYQDPDTGATWSGRGKEPAWIKGKDRKPFLIE